MRIIIALIRKEFYQIKRDKAMLFIIFGVPIIQLLILGTAISVEVKNLPIGICDLDNTELSRKYIQSFQSNEYLIVKLKARSTNELTKALEESHIKIGLTIPRGFMSDIAGGKTPVLLAQIDGVDGNGANIANGYMNSITANFFSKDTYVKSNLILRNRSITSKSEISINPEFLFNQNGVPSWHFVPGIMALLVTIVSTLLTAFSLVKEKEIGTFEQLMVTPISRIQFIIGKIAIFFVLTFIELVIAVAVIYVAYGITIKSSVLLLLSGVVLYLLNSLAIGLFVSTITKTQQQALFLAWFIMIFAIMMSGFLFPVENMPTILQEIARFNPLLYFIRILRSVFVRGSEFYEMIGELLWLFALGLGVFTASLLSFKKVIS